jgi:hypothetical protein
MVEISDKHFLFCLSISEILFVISDFIFSNAAVSKFAVVSVTKKHCSTSLVKEAELQAHIPQESKMCVATQLTKKTTVNFQTEVNRLVRIKGCDILPDAGTTMLFRNRYNTKFRNIFHKRFQF